MIQTFKVIYYKTSYKKSLKTISFFITIFKSNCFKGLIKKYVRWGGEGVGVIEKRTKTNRERRDPSMCVRSLFWKKVLRFSKWSFIVILQFFLLVIIAGWNIRQTIMKDYNIQSCQWMACDRFRQPTQDHQCRLC